MQIHFFNDIIRVLHVIYIRYTINIVVQLPCTFLDYFQIQSSLNSEKSCVIVIANSFVSRYIFLISWKYIRSRITMAHRPLRRFSASSKVDHIEAAYNHQRSSFFLLSPISHTTFDDRSSLHPQVASRKTERARFIELDRPRVHAYTSRVQSRS